MIAIVWRFEAAPGREREFEEFFGADGEWTALNRQSRSYIGSSFLRDPNERGRYLVIEYWSEMLVYEQHKTSQRTKFTRLETRRQALVTSTEAMGVFTALDVPERASPVWSQRGLP